MCFCLFSAIHRGLWTLYVVILFTVHVCLCGSEEHLPPPTVCKVDPLSLLPLPFVQDAWGCIEILYDSNAPWALFYWRGCMLVFFQWSVTAICVLSLRLRTGYCEIPYLVGFSARELADPRCSVILSCFPFPLCANFTDVVSGQQGKGVYTLSAIAANRRTKEPHANPRGLGGWGTWQEYISRLSLSISHPLLMRQIVELCVKSTAGGRGRLMQSVTCNGRGLRPVGEEEEDGGGGKWGRGRKEEKQYEMRLDRRGPHGRGFFVERRTLSCLMLWFSYSTTML